MVEKSAEYYISIKQTWANSHIGYFLMLSNLLLVASLILKLDIFHSHLTLLINKKNP